MIKFLLVLYFGSEENDNEYLDNNEFEAIADSYIEKMVEMPVIPRFGEFIDLGGNIFQVNDVKHIITKRVVEVECDVVFFYGVTAYTEDKEGWNLDHLSSDGKELLFKRVKQYEERKARSQEDEGATAQQ